MLMAECADKNLVDKTSTPDTVELERRCVNILADLSHASSAEEATGCSTTGSSEACILAGLALKWRWRLRREAVGAPAGRPNLVMGANVQVCWEKFCRSWDVEAASCLWGPTHPSHGRGCGGPLQREHDLAAMLLADLTHVITHLDGRGSTGDGKVRAGFHH